MQIIAQHYFNILYSQKCKHKDVLEISLEGLNIIQKKMRNLSNSLVTNISIM